MDYTEEEMLLIDQFKDLPKKKCKGCEKYFPIHETLFLKEKRILDGFENKCRICRNGHFLIKKRKDKAPYINKELMSQFDSVNELYEHFMKTNTLPYPSFVLDNHLEIFKYLITKENILINNLNKLNRQWFQDRKLYSSLLRMYKGNIYQFVNAAYPNLLLPWDFITVGGQYWKDKENRLTALKWLVDQLLKDKVINTIEEIPKKINGNTFKDYSLSGLLNIYYKEHAYYAFNDILPNKFYVWQYQAVNDGYFHNKENRIKSLKELIEYHLKINIEDIPKVLSYEYINLAYEDDYIKRFKSVIDKYYDNVYEYIMEVYPNTFSIKDFPYKNHYPTLDNIIVKSEPERMLHHLFIRNNLKFKYGDYFGRMNINGVNVVPDWYIYKNDKTVLVEYYGMLDMNGVDYGYKDRHDQKDRLYKQLCKDDNTYEYLPLYIEDMKNNFEGVLSKLREYDII